MLPQIYSTMLSVEIGPNLAFFGKSVLRIKKCALKKLAVSGHF
jgi:hypothetical protein